MISLRNVSKQFREIIAVDSISFEVKKGEIVGLLGLNGAGKTTTMRLMTGILTPHKGSVLIDGHSPIDDHLIVAQKIGYLPENNPLYTDMKIQEYLSFIAGIKRSKKNEIRE